MMQDEITPPIVAPDGSPASGVLPLGSSSIERNAGLIQRDVLGKIPCAGAEEPPTLPPPTHLLARRVRRPSTGPRHGSGCRLSQRSSVARCRGTGPYAAR